MLFRAIIYVVASVLAISILKSLIGMIMRTFSEFFAPGSPASSSTPKKPPATLTEALKKDPVCGTFIAQSSAVQKTVHGTTYYFCSADCRDKFKAA